MTRRHLTPEQKLEAIAMREAGYTLSVIAEKTNISVTSLKRIFKQNNVTKGELAQKAIDNAREELLTETNTTDKIKRHINALISDDIAQINRIREVMVTTIEKLSAKDTTEALQVMRALSACAVALKSTSETARKSLGMDKENEVSGELPKIIVEDLTTDEIEEIKQRQQLKDLNNDELADSEEHNQKELETIES